MTLPDFLVIGAQKSGTSWLARQLAQHPAIWMHPREIRYFNEPANLARGAQWYERQFEAAPHGALVGEKTPGYMCANLGSVGNPRVHESLHELLPEAKLLAVLRDPVERAISAFNHHASRLRIPRGVSIDDALLGRHPALEQRYGFAHRGVYVDQLEALLALFPREKLLVLVLEEDVHGAPEQTLARVCRFLGVSNGHPFADAAGVVNPAERSSAGALLRRFWPGGRRLAAWLDRGLPARRPARPEPSTRRELAARFAPHNERLFALLERRVPAWDPAGSTETQ